MLYLELVSVECVVTGVCVYVTEQDLLYHEFMTVCQPSHYMNLATFSTYMTTLKGARPQNVEGFFR